MTFAEYKNGDLNEQDFCGLNYLWSEWLDPEKEKQESMVHGSNALLESHYCIRFLIVNEEREHHPSCEEPKVVSNVEISSKLIFIQIRFMITKLGVFMNSLTLKNLQNKHIGKGILYLLECVSAHFLTRATTKPKFSSYINVNPKIHVLTKGQKFQIKHPQHIW